MRLLLQWLTRARRSRVSASVFALGFSTVIGKGLMLLALVVATRSAGPEAWGRFAYALTLLYLIQVVADFGFHTYIMRESARGEWSAGLYKAVVQSRLGLGILASFLMLGVLYGLDKPREILASVAILAASLLFRAYYGTQRSFLQGQEKMWTTAWIDSVLYGSFFLAVATLSVQSTVAPTGLSWGWAAASAFCAGASLLAYRRHSFGSSHDLSQPVIPVLVAMRGALPFLAVNVAVVLLHRVGILVLEHYHSADQVGHFAAAYNLFDALSLIPGLLVTAVFPRLARGSGSGHQLRYLTPVVVAITSVPTAFVWLFADWITLTLYGDAYAPAVAALRILLLGLPLMAATGSLAHQLFARGKERASSLSTVFAFILNTFLCMMLAPEYGIQGVAVATTLALLANASLHLFVFYRKAS